MHELRLPERWLASSYAAELRQPVWHRTANDRPSLVGGGAETVAGCLVVVPKWRSSRGADQYAIAHPVRPRADEDIAPSRVGDRHIHCRQGDLGRPALIFVPGRVLTCAI